MLQTCINRSSCSARVAQPPFSGAARQAQRRSVRATVASTLLHELPETAAYTTLVDTESLNKRLEAKAKALIALEDQEIPSWPLVRIRFQRESGLGDAWKIVGRVPELGRFAPSVAPYLTWSQGNHWTYEGRVRCGTWLFKFVMRRADGAYLWEESGDRVLNVPETAGPEDVLEIVINDVRLPQ